MEKLGRWECIRPWMQVYIGEFLKFPVPQNLSKEFIKYFQPTAGLYSPQIYLNLICIQI